MASVMITAGIVHITSTHGTDLAARGSYIMLFRMLTLLKAYFSSSNGTQFLYVSDLSTIQMFSSTGKTTCSKQRTSNY